MRLRVSHTVISALILTAGIGGAFEARAQMDTDRFIACNESGGIVQNGRCVPAGKFKNVTDQNMARIKAEREQERKKICLSIGDPCAMPMCKTPGITCPDNIEKVRKLVPEAPVRPKPVLPTKPDIANLTKGFTQLPEGTSPPAVAPFGQPLNNRQPVPDQAPNPQGYLGHPGLAAPQTGTAAPQPMSEVGSTPQTTNPVARIQAPVQQRPAPQPAAPAEPPPEKDKESGGGLPGWMNIFKK